MIIKKKGRGKFSNFFWKYFRQNYIPEIISKKVPNYVKRELIFFYQYTNIKNVGDVKHIIVIN